MAKTKTERGELLCGECGRTFIENLPPLFTWFDLWRKCCGRFVYLIAPEDRPEERGAV
jgi:hypothetical protein